MGCVTSKQFRGGGEDGSNIIERRRSSNNSLRRFLSSTARRHEDEDYPDEVVAFPDSSVPTDQLPAAAPPVLAKPGIHWRQSSLDSVAVRNHDQLLRMPGIPNGIKREHVEASWPEWLTNVAGDAVRGWLPRKAESFEKLKKIGQGTYSTVYKARDLESGKIVALKRVMFANMDPESVRFMAREIHILRRLDHPNVVKLLGLIASSQSSSLYLVFEYMEHDLAGLAAAPGIKFTEPQIKCYMQQLFAGLDHCHSHGVLHRDIKGANLLIDNNGVLKIADFGLATFFDSTHKQQLTSRVVTLWYRPPELLIGATSYGASVDLWSAGCLLAELLSGKPIMPGRTEVEQLHRIFKLCGSPSEEFWSSFKMPCVAAFKPQHPYKRCINETFRDFPASALSLLDCLLAIEPGARGTAAYALQSEFFTTNPLACDPASLPKYPPSKEYDAKLRDDEARRQRAAANNRREPESGRRKLHPVPDVDAEFQQRQLHANQKSNRQEHFVRGSGITEAAENGHPRLAPSMMMQRGRSGAEGRSNHIPDQKGYRHIPRSISPSSDLSNSPLSNCKLPGVSEGANHPGSQFNPSSNPQEGPSSCRKDGLTGKEPAAVVIQQANSSTKNQFQFSGPLILGGGRNMEDMLKEHERHIQQAVRRARFERKNKHCDEKGQLESLLHASRNDDSGFHH